MASSRSKSCEWRRVGLFPPSHCGSIEALSQAPFHSFATQDLLSLKWSATELTDPGKYPVSMSPPLDIMWSITNRRKSACIARPGNRSFLFLTQNNSYLLSTRQTATVMTQWVKVHHVVHFNVPRGSFETNSRLQKRYSEGGKKNRGCRGLLGRIISVRLFQLNISLKYWGCGSVVGS